VAKYNEFTYGDGTKYGTEVWDANLKWTFIVAWDGYYGWGNEAQRMVNFTMQRGRTQAVGEKGFIPFGVGKAMGEFDNEDGRYDALNENSPLYPHVLPGKFTKIAVKDETEGTNYAIMFGVVVDVQLFTRDGREMARIVVEDGLRWFVENTVNIGLASSASVPAIISLLQDNVDWPTRWGSDISSLPDYTQVYWWAWNEQAFKALTDLNNSQLSVAFHSREGNFTWRPITYSYRRSIALNQDELLRDIGRPVPWEYVKNSIRAESRPKKLDLVNTVLWELQDTPSIDANETYYVEAQFKYQEWAPCGSSMTFDFTVNAAEDGSGADLTSQCLLEYDSDIGPGAKIWITNLSGSDGYITALSATGDAIYDPWLSTKISYDQDSINQYGQNTLNIRSPWLEDNIYASYLATIALAMLKDPEAYLTVQLENRTHKQFYPDLWDLAVADLPEYGLLRPYRIGYIEHAWLNSTGQAIRTKFKLEPYREEGEEIVAFKGCQVVRSSSESIPNSTNTDVSWNAEDIDVGSYHSTSSNSERVTIPSGGDGYYLVATTIQWEGNATGYRKVRIQVNGSTQREGIVNDISEAEIFDQHVAQVLHLEANDYITVEVFQDSGGALNVNADSVLSVSFLGA